ncbi:protein phosphatase 1, regulatory subunit 13Bb isoform X3 [Alosa sapidissima]|uniref:protein phosphatase 1, regulatory subunit 13Bb isoform X3 n=1 Tax=Alosa sapidissima TaxID=34773 RepID=UPI001C09EA61|nr:protein phosphatase 1, regulatory subunit 13Bb isoform X3 [Alosa sapidissima]
MMPMILTVYLNDGEQAVSEVPITPETSCRDVVEFCKEPGESGCHLAEVWRGNERAIPFDHMMYDHLQKWGTRRQEVKFFLRHEDSPTENSDQGSQQSQDHSSRWSGSSSEKHNENGVGNPRVELTLSELQEMATRQQQQIEAQQQMLVAKEQRLRYLKQQERRQQQTVSEAEKLQRLKDRVESQEAKLKKIRAMRGQVDYSKVINGNLSVEIEHISGLFQEKQAELQTAVLRVEQLSQQLDELRRGKLNGLQGLSGQLTGTAALELRKLYQELQIRNKLNQEQNSKLQQQKELLNKRNMEVTLMDKRITELRQRLYKKKAEARQKENVPLNRTNGPPSPQPAPGGPGRVAAVGPYIQVPVPVRQEAGYTVPPDPLKPQSLGVNSPANHARSKSDGVRKPPGPWKVSDLDIIVDPVQPTLPELRPGGPAGPAGPGAPTSSSFSSSSSSSSCMAGPDGASPNEAGWPTIGKGNASLKPPDWKESGGDGPGKTPSPTSTPADKAQDGSKPAPPISKPQPPPYGAHHHSSAGSGSSVTSALSSSSNSGSTSSLELRKDVPPPPLPGSGGPALPPLPPPAWPRTGPASQGSSSQQIQQRISVPPSPTYQPGSPLFPPGDRSDPPLAVAVRPFIPDKGSRPQSPRKGPATMNSSSIYHMYLQQAAPKNYPFNNKPAVRAVYGKPVLHSSSTPTSPLPFSPASGHFPGFLGGPGEDLPDGGGGFGDMVGELPPLLGGGAGMDLPHPGPPPPTMVDHIPRPLSPTKLTPMVHSPMRYQSDVELEALRKRLANAPRPLKKRSSITEPEGPSGPNIQKLLYQRFNTLAGGMEGGVGVGPPPSGVTPFYQPGSAVAAAAAAACAVGQGDADNGNPPSEVPSGGMAVAVSEGMAGETSTSTSTTTTTTATLPQGDANDNQPAVGVGSPPASEVQAPPVPAASEEDNTNNNTQAATSATTILPSPVMEATSPQEAGSSPSAPTEKRSNLKKPNSERAGSGQRVKFHPLALLLDASLEGEFDLVQRIIYEVENPSKPNDEGITPLHNSVCAGHHHIVKFLLDFGVNVNAADSDGWTPLHCAASCNSVHLCKLLVESGAAIFATTISDVETAADKCEEMEEGYIQCSQFLYGVQEKLGVMNKGTVYALWDYEAQSSDELSFHEGDAITILRRKDDNETEWWWGRLNDKEGYVPRNLLGLYPRIKPRQRSLA